MGEVAIKVAPGFTVPPLALASDNFFSFLWSDTEKFKAKDNGNTIILQRAPGAAKLQYERSPSDLVIVGRAVDWLREKVGLRFDTACNFKVERNRVVSMTLRTVGREVTCVFDS